MFLIQSHIVPEGTEEIRLYDYVPSIFPNIPSRSAIKKHITRGKILVDGEKAQTGTWVKVGQKIDWMDMEETPPKQYNLNFEIVYQDDHLAIVNKPGGIPVSGNQFMTMQNALIGKFEKSNEPDALSWAKPVHRLDAPTCGLLIVAKTAKALMLLGQMLENKEIDKKYCAVVKGDISEDGVVNSLIEEKRAETEYKKVYSVPSLRNGFLSLVDLYPKTGRTHQLRIHMSEAGHPIMGDTLYDRKEEVFKGKGLFLCAIGLRFIHPITKEEVVAQINEPSKFETLLKREERRFESFNEKDKE
ncbi:MAG: 23S rRNA pseudouridine1911/1915/1917 synthase [Salibacteraceae bacterium]